jgi:hypothetical protein
MNSMVKDLGNGLSIIVCSVMLSGCAMPLPFQLASWALDGISFLATEKSLSDHGLSLVAQKDCAIWRGLKGDNICSEISDDEILTVAAADPLVLNEQLIEKTKKTEQNVNYLTKFKNSDGTLQVDPAVVSGLQQYSMNGERLITSGKRVWSDSLDADLYFVIGSFSMPDNANRMIDRFRELGPAVMASRPDGLEVYRVAVGPFAADQEMQIRHQLNLEGISNSWAMRIDHSEWTLASPKALSEFNQSVAEAHQKGKPELTVRPVDADEIAETPDEEEDIQSSKFIDKNNGHLVIGYLSNADNVSNVAKTNIGFGPRIISTETWEGWQHRDVIGPESLEVRRIPPRAGIDQI